MIKAIIPAAGFGTRMGMKPNESKELLPHNGRPLIEHTLELCSIFKLTPHVITRVEKQDLIEYCKARSIECQILDKVEGEWPDTVLKSQPYWDWDNILLLPDTVFGPISAIETMKMNLSLGCRYVLALHNVADISMWGSVQDYYLIEKSSVVGPGKAWGILGFNSVYGEELFTAMSKRNEPFRLRDCAFVQLANFADLTREKIVST